MQLTYLIAKDYARTTGGWIYNERLLWELETLGWAITRVELPAGFPDPGEGAMAAALATVAGLPPATLILADQVCLSPLSARIRAGAAKHRLAMIVHHPQILEGSRPADVAARLDAAEREAMAAADLVIATSPLTAKQLLADYPVRPDRLVVAEPGTDVYPPSPGSGGRAVHLVSLGSVIPRKRHELIVAALARLKDLDWRLSVAGSLTMVPEHAEKLRGLIESSGLADRARLLGAVTGAEAEALWQSADVYVAASTHEGFGMAVAEAVARQVPVVTTFSGAVGEWFPRAAGAVVETNNATALAAGLRAVISDPGARARLRAGAAAARARLATWKQTAARVNAGLGRVLASGRF